MLSCHFSSSPVQYHQFDQPSNLPIRVQRQIKKLIVVIFFYLWMNIFITSWSSSPAVTIKKKRLVCLSVSLLVGVVKKICLQQFKKTNGQLTGTYLHMGQTRQEVKRPKKLFFSFLLNFSLFSRNDIFFFFEVQDGFYPTNMPKAPI